MERVEEREEELENQNLVVSRIDGRVSTEYSWSKLGGEVAQPPAKKRMAGISASSSQIYQSLLPEWTGQIDRRKLFTPLILRSTLSTLPSTKSRGLGCGSRVVRPGSLVPTVYTCLTCLLSFSTLDSRILNVTFS